MGVATVFRFTLRLLLFVKAVRSPLRNVISQCVNFSRFAVNAESIANIIFSSRVIALPLKIQPTCEVDYISATMAGSMVHLCSFA